MIRRENACSDDRLLNLLVKEGDEDVESMEQHLTGCSRCQSRLEQLAANENLWREAKTLLSSNAGLDESGDQSRRLENKFQDRLSPWSCRTTAWTESMAKQMLSPPSHPEMLGRIGRYEVERVIGSGGMGVVFKAFDTELNRPVAVKVLAPYLAGSGAARQRFAREARAAAAIVHEHVVAIHNVETSSDSPFLVMHYIAGESLQQRLDREGPLDVCEILRIAMQTAFGLGAAHAQGLVHRDVKPSNILLEHGIERTLLTDFGLARASDDASLTHTGYHPGTPQYMSPEQARGESVDTRSDLFSLGSVIYAMCTGRPPFRAETSYGILRKITDCEPRPIREVNSAIPIWLEKIVDKLLAKSPNDRFPSAEHVANLLRDCLAHLQTPTTFDLPAEVRQPSRRERIRAWRIAMTSLVFALAVCAGAYGLFVVHREDQTHSNAASLSHSDSATGTIDSATSSSASISKVRQSNQSEWDNTAAEIKLFSRDVDHFESRAKRELMDISDLKKEPLE